MKNTPFSRPLFVRLFVCFIFYAAFVHAAVAQPVNDNCIGAINVPTNSDLNCLTTLQGTTAGATPTLVGCKGTADDDVWYKFVASNTRHRITISNPTNDVVLQVFSGTCDALTAGACEDVSGNEQYDWRNLTIGQTYYFRVYSYYTAVSSNFTICIGTLSPPPLNDECLGAVNVPINSDLNCLNTLQGTTVGATSSQAACKGTADDDVWYKFVATHTRHRITINPTNDVVLQTFSGTCNSLVPVTCEDRNGDEQYDWQNLTVGQTYYFRVYSYYNAVSSNFSVCIGTPPPAPVNNDCAGAINVPVTTTLNCLNTLQGTTAGATQSQVGCNGIADDDVWYKFVATSASHHINISGGKGYTVLETFSGTCANLTAFPCKLDYYGNVEQQLNGLTIGQTYYFRVYTYDALVATTFNVCVSTPSVPPVNDNCAGAINVPVNSTLSCLTTLQGTTAGALQSQVGCSGTADDDVWYKFVATSASHRINISEGTGYTVLETFSGTCANLTALVCKLDYYGNVEQQLNGLTIGQTYYFRVYTYNALVTTTFKVCVSTPSLPPVNDNCAGAINVPINSTLSCLTTLQGTTAGALQSQEGCSGTADDDVWYKFVATSASHRINISEGTGYTVLEVFSGTCPNLTALVCKLDYYGSVEQQINALTIGQTYYFRVYTYNALVTTTFKVCVSTPPLPPVNDNCAGAINVPITSTSSCLNNLQGTTTGALQSQEGCSGTADDDVWYKFVATSVSHRINVSEGTQYMAFQVFSGTCGNLTSLICRGEYSGNIEHQLNGLTIGQTYYLRVYSYYSLEIAHFNICISTSIPDVIPATNNECANAISVPVNANLNCGTVLLGTTVGATQSQVGCTGTADDDVWYKFVATSVSHRIKVSEATQYMVLQAFSGACGSLTSIICKDDNSIEHQLNGLTIGQTYYLRVYTYYSAVTSTFKLCIGTPSVPPANNECAGAITATINADLNCGTPIFGTTAGATESQAACSGTADDDVWYKFVATSVSHRINLSEATEYMVVQAFSGACNNLTAIVCKEGNSIEHQLNGLTIGQTYYLRIYSYYSLKIAPFKLCIGTPSVPPVNNECAGATTVPINTDLNCGTPIFGTTAGATESQAACTGTADDDVWYKFVATSVSHRINISEATEYMVLEAFSGACNNLTAIFCKDGNSIEHQLNGLTIGQTYYLRVYSYYSLQIAHFKLCIGTPSVPPVNNECAGAINVPINSDLNCNTKILGTTAGATESQAACTGNADDDVWYKFVATSARHRITLNEASEYPVLEIFTGTCGNLTSVFCKSGWQIEHQLNNLTVGQTYYARVYTDGALKIGTFKLCIGTPSVPPVNNECAGAINVPINPDLNCGTRILGTTAGATESQAACTGVSDDDVWYKFVATSTSHRITLNEASEYPVLETFSGTCATLTSLDCRYDYSYNIEHQMNGLTVGQTYYFRIYTEGSLVTTNFKVCMTTPPAPPVNDNCAGAISVPINTALTCVNTLQGTTAGALQSQVGCDGTADDDVWYKFVATNASHRIHVSDATARILVEFFSGTCNNLTSLACRYEYSYDIEHQLNGLTIGQTYYFRVYTEGALVTTNFKVCLTTPPVPPANDNCAGAISVPINTTLSCVNTLQGTTIGALQSQAGCGGTADDDVWYKFVATSASHRINVSDATERILLQAFSGTCGNLTALACRYEYSYDIEYQLNGLVIGQTYYFRVYTEGSLVTTNFKVCMTTPPVPPANDNCAGAINVPVNTTLACSSTVQGTTVGALQSRVGCTGDADDDVWYKFVATKASHRITVSDASTYIIMEAFSGTCATLTSLVCRNEYSSHIEYQLNGLTVGQTYYLRVYTQGSLVATTFKVCISTPSVPPVNDNCAGAINVPVSNTLTCLTTLQGTTAGALESQAGCSGVADDDVWYKFVAANTRQRINISNATDNIVLEVFSGTCPNLVSLVCRNEYDNAIDHLLEGLTIGQTYYFRVYSREALTTIDFNVCVTTPPPAPSNDECSGALSVTVSNSNTCTTLLAGTTLNAFRSNNANCGNGADVWYKFVATNATHRISALSSGANPIYDMGFELYKGTCATLVSKTCVNDYWGSTTESKVFKDLTVGTTYYLRVFGVLDDISMQGTFSLCVNTPSVPSNDECATAIRVPVSTGGTCNTTVIGTTRDATVSNINSCMSSTADDVWFSFTAISSAHTIVVAPNGTLSNQLKNPAFQLFEGTCNALAPLKCVNDNWGSNEERYIASSLTVGTTYFIRVGTGNYGTDNGGDFSVCVYTSLDLVHDLAIESIEQPISGCNLSNQIVKVNIKNLGNSDQTNVQLAYKVDNGTAIIGNTGSLVIPALSSVSYTFPTLANLSGIGTHTIKVYPVTNIDINRLNDTLIKSIKNLNSLAAPTNLIPLTGATNLDLPLNLSWSAVPNASTYDVYVWKNSETTPISPTFTVNDANSYTAGSYSVPFANSFKWKVTAKATGCPNLFSSEQTFSTKKLPDLSVEAVTAPSQVFTEQEIDINYTVKNSGLGETGRYNWYDAVYLASEPTINAGTFIRLAYAENINALAPNQNYKRANYKVKIPTDVLGTYYLIVWTNLYSNMEETSFANNVSSPIAINVQASPSPDLTVPSVLVSPSNTFSQEQVNVAYTVQNTGTAPVGQTYIDKIYASSDVYLSPQTDYLLGEFNRSNSIPVAGIQQASEAVTLPVGISGNYYILVQTDATNTNNEGLNEGNNTGVSNALNVILSPPIDVLVANAVVPNVVNPNQTVQLNWQVENAGGSPTLDNWLTRIYISESENIANATLLKEIPFNGIIEAGQFANFNTSVTIPNFDKEASYFFIIQLDATNTQFEFTYENNNIYTKGTALKVPDLNPTNIVLNGALTSSSTVASTISVKNIGQGTVYNTPITYHLYLDQNTVLNPSTATLVGMGTRPTSLLLPNDVVTISADIAIPDGISGAYNLFAVIDQANTVPETNDNNNVFSKSIAITLANYPNLVVAPFSSGATATAGDTLTLTYTLRNTGTGAITAKDWQDRIYLSNSAVFNAATALLLKTVSQTAVTLAASGNAPQSTSVILPENLSSGTYYLVVVADASNTIYEYLNENDNTTLSNAIAIAAYPVTDIQVTSAAVNKMTIESGKTLTLNWTVKNNATKATPTGNIIDAFFLSLDTIVNPGDISLGTFTQPSRLIGGSSSSNSKVLTIPNGVIGTYYVLVQTDFSQIVKDNYRINNVKAAANLNNTNPPTIQIVVSSLVDLNLVSATMPIEGVAGQPINIPYRVRNDGSHTNTTGSWTDAAYLSGGANSYYSAEIGAVQTTKTLAPTAFYDATIMAFLPLDASGNYYLTVKTDDTDQQYEHLAEGNNQILQSILVAPAVPCDLMPKNITLPTSGIIGNAVTVSWQLHNKGVNPARGYLKEGIYWSKDTIWDSNDILAGSLESYINLLPNAFQAQSLLVTLEDIVPDNWYAIIKSDIRNNFLESDELNNASKSMNTITTDVPALTLNVITTLSSVPNQQSFLKLSIPANLVGETILVTIEGTIGNTSGNELYTRFNAMPSRAESDISGTIPFSASQKLYIPAAELGTYYFLINDNRREGATQAINVLAKQLPFKIETVEAAKGGNTAPVTLKIIGSKFDQSTSFALESATLGNLSAQNVYYVNPNLVYATFNLLGKTLGLYDVAAIKTGGQRAVLPLAFEVIKGTPPSGGTGASQSLVCTISYSDGKDNLSVLAQGPPSSRPLKPVLVTISYENVSSIDMPIPKRLLIAKEKNGSLSFNPSDFTKELKELLLEFKETNGPPNILRPGASGVIQLYAFPERGIRLLELFLTE